MDPSAAVMNRIMTSNKDVLVAYTGYISEELLGSLGNVLRDKLDNDFGDRLRTKRAFSLFCEQTQNIIRYSLDRITVGAGEAGALGRGMVVVGYADDLLYIVCGNFIQAGQEEKVRTRLNYLAGLSHEELRAYYKQKIREPSDTGSKGGSVGLIEIARRSERPLEYEFLANDGERVFFCLKTYA